MGIIDWLNANSGAVIAIAAIIFVGIISYYVYLTWRLLKANDTPEIFVSLRPHEISVNLVMLHIENIGTGAARNLQFATDPSSIPCLDIPFEKIGFLKSGIDYFEPGRKIEQFLVSVVPKGKFDELKQTRLTVTITYKDSANRTYERAFPLDFSENVGFSQIGTPPLYEIAKTTKKIQEDLHLIAIGSRKPIILTESLSKRRLGQYANSFERRIEQFPKEVQEEILHEVDRVVTEREREEHEKGQNDETTAQANSS